MESLGDDALHSILFFLEPRAGVVLSAASASVACALESGPGATYWAHHCGRRGRQESHASAPATSSPASQRRHLARRFVALLPQDAHSFIPLEGEDGRMAAGACRRRQWAGGEKARKTLMQQLTSGAILLNEAASLSTLGHNRGGYGEVEVRKGTVATVRDSGTRALLQSLACLS